MAADTNIYIVDQVTPRPGKAEAYLKQYMDIYAPLASAAGLKLEHTWVNPPLWLDGEQQNTLVIVWSVESASAYWMVQAKIRWDRSFADWWADTEMMVASRTRLVVSEPSSIASLTNV